jgi:hypothetical protein
MEMDFLTPVDQKIVAFAKGLSPVQIGGCITLHTEKKKILLNDYQVAIVAVPEYRGSKVETLPLNYNKIREQLYSLYIGNWTTNIIDIGDIKNGETASDTHYATKYVVESLLRQHIKIIFLGGSHDLTYPIYRAFDNLDQMVNLVVVDNKFDLGNSELTLCEQNYLSKIIIDTPNNLNNYSNIGFQTYYNSQEEINVVFKLHFDAYRLGEILTNIEFCEPILRNADIVSIDLCSLKTLVNNNFIRYEPNGIDAKDLCAIARYSGMGDKTSVFGVFNISSQPEEAALLAQTMWYFIEGLNIRMPEFPARNNDDFLNYVVPVEDQDIVFFKSVKTQRWWMVVPLLTKHYNKDIKESLLPCSHDDYLNCCEQQIPDRWWKAQHKNIV